MSLLRITSYNVHSCVGSDGHYDVQRVGQTISATKPDLVALQEIEVNHVRQQTRLWSTVHFDNQPKLLSEAVGLQHCVFAPAIRSVAVGNLSNGKESHNESDCHGSFGIAILSRFPILDTKTLNFTQYKRKTLRNALAVLVETEGVKVWFVCTHLGCHFGGEQYEQVKELLPFLHTLAQDLNASGVILAGDTNSPPFFKAIRHLKRQGMIDTWDQAGGRSCSTTFPALGWPCCYSWTCCPPLLKLDYIMFRPSTRAMQPCLECIATWVVQDGDSEDNGLHNVDLMASDHRPLCATFHVRRLSDDRVEFQAGGGGMSSPALMSVRMRR
mmetsp:Transcript_47070/g.81018  ORF Transcript_47070/g.81018 Transcript_47070/m.81018 type:complete len:327 (+) Transcript_47070:133-1113(+)|eukprot:CAMPEP_0206382994 /NCGR_PEP_ID=MMETSP0294-20121207/13641_1 /ASSEMBLY_ACC=CAM_ASM_000327 /TAXON_ID=39354 /ORGANISM="Heterosigma akashiwo, Strain CCMP2393" /LENGTH=326 /DNA_ID=CAMNT_0053832881 /DNA_START=133 /DNA_END=1113 /DNA_ORIENTATION=+